MRTKTFASPDPAKYTAAATKLTIGYESGESGCGGCAHANDRVRSMRYTRGGEDVLAIGYGYDREGQVTSKSIEFADHPALTVYKAFRRDALGRVIEEVQRKQAIQGLVDNTAGLPDLPLPVEPSLNDVGARNDRFAYDAAGDPIEGTMAGIESSSAGPYPYEIPIFALDFDEAGVPTGDRTYAGIDPSFIEPIGRDANGNRTGTKYVQFKYDADQDGIFGEDRETCYVLADAEGSPVMMVDATGSDRFILWGDPKSDSSHWRVDYSTLGEPEAIKPKTIPGAAAKNVTKVPFAANGSTYDLETASYPVGGKQYDPGTGNTLQKGPDVAEAVTVEPPAAWQGGLLDFGSGLVSGFTNVFAGGWIDFAKTIYDLATNPGPYWDAIMGLIDKLTDPAMWSALWDAAKEAVKEVLSDAWSYVEKLLDAIKQRSYTLAGTALGSLLGYITNKYVGGGAAQTVTKIFKKIADKLGEIGKKLKCGIDGAKAKGATSEAITPYWPPNNGAIPGTERKAVLEPGVRVDRYGHEGGTFTSPEGTPYPMRSLQPGSDSKPYNVYEVAKPFEVETGTTMPWFGETGYGTQHKLPKPVKDLIESGHLIRVSGGGN